MISNPIIFYTAAFIIFVFALVSIFAKNLICSLLSAIMVFFAAAIFFYILGSEYNAIIQAAIYGLAVPIIIGISIMFTTNKHEPIRNWVLLYFVVIAGIVFVRASQYLLKISLVMLPDTFNILEPVQISSFDVITSFAKGIFINYVWAFELVSLLLTIVIVGLSLFNKRRMG